jgi:putative inorganic carbon (HCO3(-)) transporter
MLLTFSRAGWTGLACAAAFYIAARARTRHTGLVVGSAVVTGALLIVLMVFNVHHDPSENYTRLSIWQAAIGVIDRFPLTGVGPFGFSHIYAQVRLPDGDATAFHAHSVYLTFFSELGVVGISAFLWVLWRFAVELRARLAVASSVARDFAIAIAAGLVGSLVQGLIDTVSVAIFGLWIPTLALALVAAQYGLGDER